jgi:hypothetical protein
MLIKSGKTTPHCPKQPPVMNTLGDPDSSVVNTPESLDSPLVNTQGRFNSPVMNTPVSQLLGDCGTRNRTGLLKKLSGDKKTRE